MSCVRGDYPVGLVRVALRAVLVLAVVHQADLVAHPHLRDQRVRHAVDLLQVVVGAGGHLAEEDLLGDPAAERRADAVEQLFLGLQRALVREVLGEPQGAFGPRDDRELEQRHATFEEPADDCVAALVHGDRLSLLLIHQPLLLDAADDALHGHLEVFR